MSLENPQSNSHEASAVDRSDAAFAAAEQLIAENPLLADNPRVKALAENDFILEDGTKLDPGNFLAKMVDYLEMQNGGAVTQEEISHAVETVIHSMPPELESMVEDRPN